MRWTFQDLSVDVDMTYVNQHKVWLEDVPPADKLQNHQLDKLDIRKDIDDMLTLDTLDKSTLTRVPLPKLAAHHLMVTPNRCVMPSTSTYKCCVGVLS